MIKLYYNINNAKTLIYINGCIMEYGMVYIWYGIILFDI